MKLSTTINHSFDLCYTGLSFLMSSLAYHLEPIATEAVCLFVLISDNLRKSALTAGATFTLRKFSSRAQALDERNSGHSCSQFFQPFFWNLDIMGLEAEYLCGFYKLSANWAIECGNLRPRCVNHFLKAANIKHVRLVSFAHTNRCDVLTTDLAQTHIKISTFPKI